MDTRLSAGSAHHRDHYVMPAGRSPCLLHASRADRPASVGLTQGIAAQRPRIALAVAGQRSIRDRKHHKRRNSM